MISQKSDEPNFASSGIGSASGSGSISSSQNENASPLWNYVTKLKKKGYWRNLEFPIEVPLPCQSQTGIAIESSSKKRKSNFSPIVKSFNMNVRAQLDEEIARIFYTGGLPFNFARNPHYQRAFTFAATHDIAGYVPPSNNKLRTSLLLQEKNNVDKLLQPIKATWQEK
ncbi:hypothetical protein V6N12_055727 [Hibiscus sabdariffa]|uniref:Uncharacterized protein n=1 Tax=Hibiscus sabdariffa TaxID=183260 RepID=A0ABR2AUQ6_9ROSI